MHRGQKREEALKNFEPFQIELQNVSKIKSSALDMLVFQEKWDVQVSYIEGEVLFSDTFEGSPVKIWGSPFDVLDYENANFQNPSNKLIVQIDMNYSDSQIKELFEKIIHEARSCSPRQEATRERGIRLDQIAKIIGDYYLDPEVSLESIVKKYDFTHLKHSHANLVSIIKDKKPYFEDLIDPRGVILDRAHRTQLNYSSKINFIPFAL